MQLKIGADPEFFCKRNGQHISAHDIVPGTKHKPHKIDRGAVQADGTAIEFNIDPATTSAEFVLNIETVLHGVRGMVPAELEFDYSPSIIYPREYFDKLPKFSKELGCDPDYNAYTGQRNAPPNGDPNNTMRTGAGHIHLGWTTGADPLDKSHMWDCCHLVKRFDEFFGSFERFWDKDNRRRQMYGAPGAFRPKSYGCEYRVLSNAWLKYPKLWPWIFDSAQYIFEHELNNATGDRWWDEYGVWDPVAAANYRVRNFFGSKAPEFKMEYIS